MGCLKWKFAIWAYAIRIESSAPLTFGSFVRIKESKCAILLYNDHTDLATDKGKFLDYSINC